MKYKGKEIPPYESFYWNTTEDFFRGILGGGISRTVKCDDSLAVIIEYEYATCIMGINKINKIGNYSPSGHNASSIVDTEGIAPAVMENHGTVTAIVEPKAVSYTRDKDGSVTDRHLNDVFNTIHTGTGGGGNTDCYIAEPKILTPRRTEFGKQIRKQYEAHQVDMSRHDMTQLEPRKDGVSNTLTSVQKDNLVAEPLLIPEATTKGYAEVYDGDSVNLALPNSKTRRGRAGHQQANTLDTSCNQGVVTNYRIRKLTPRECFRLMDVSEPDIDKLLNAGISNSQLYKLAGNSIVVSCLYHIFRKMFIEKENENQQLTLF